MRVHIKAARILIISILIFSCLLTGCSTAVSEKKLPVVGVVVAKFNDTWRTSVRNVLYKMAEGKVQIDIWSGDNSQKTENEKVNLLIKRKVKCLIVNLVDASGAASIIDKAKEANIPVIFFNTEPSAEDLKKWDKVYYVGSEGEQSGDMQGQILVRYFTSNPAKDGIIRYVMLEGQDGHPDTISRTKFSVKTIENAGLKVQKVAEVSAAWDRNTAQEKMEDILATQDKIDCVIANNDDMALGAIDALKAKGYFKNGKSIPVVGVDATSTALYALKEGTLLGTVLNDAENQGKAIFNLGAVLASGKKPDKINFKNTITDGKYIWIDYKIITKENIEDAK